MCSTLDVDSITIIFVFGIDKNSMNTRIQKASFTINALRAVAFSILLIFVWNLSSTFVNSDEIQMEIVADDADEDLEIDDDFLLDQHPTELYARIANQSFKPSFLDRYQFLIKPHLDELPSPPPERA